MSEGRRNLKIEVIPNQRDNSKAQIEPNERSFASIVKTEHEAKNNRDKHSAPQVNPDDKIPLKKFYDSKTRNQRSSVQTQAKFDHPEVDETLRAYVDELKQDKAWE